MRGLLPVLLTLVCIFGVRAQGIEYPVPVPVETAVSQTSLQKGIARSTDICMLALPVATLAGVIIAGDWEGLRQGVFTGVTTAAATLVLKYTVSEWRPDRSDRHSFPSGHTSVGFATATFLQRRYGWKLGVPAYAVATWIGVGRVWSRRHHWWDAVAGAAIGAGSALLFTRPWARGHSLAISPTVLPPADPMLTPLAPPEPQLGATVAFTF